MASTRFRQYFREKIFYSAVNLPGKVFPREIPEFSTQSFSVLGGCNHNEVFVTFPATDELVVAEITTGAEDNQRRCSGERNGLSANCGGSHNHSIRVFAENAE